MFGGAPEIFCKWYKKNNKNKIIDNIYKNIFLYVSHIIILL